MDEQETLRQKQPQAQTPFATEQSLYEFRYVGAQQIAFPLEQVVGELRVGIVGGRYRINGSRSTIRFAHQHVPPFLVMLRPNQDPSKVVQFVKMKGDTSSRSSSTPKPGKRSKDELPFVAEVYGKGFRLGVGRLEPGEYCFSLTVSNEAYCFGMDP